MRIWENIRIKAGVMIMEALFWTVEEVALRAKQFYAQGIRVYVEHGDNMGCILLYPHLVSMVKTSPAFIMSIW
jgi:hypothetical protein